MSCILSVKLGFLVFAYAVAISIAYTGAYRIGVNYGMVSDNIPPPGQVISMCTSRNIRRLRLFEPNPAALAALSSSGIEVILGTRNEDLPKLAVDPSYAKTWVETHVLPHIDTTLFKYISAGNEVIPGKLANYVLPAMKNLDAALKSVGRKIPVSTTVPSNVLGISYPPSAGKFSPVTAPVMEPIVAFLASESYPLLVNVYPYFAYIGNPKDISLDYALFNSKKVVVRDGALGYKNLFDAMVDAIYAALEKAGGSTVKIVVSETGWPSAGGDGLVATINNAQTYNRNLISHLALSPGTPRRPTQDLETYIFALFNEDLKAVGTERNFGLFYPNMTEVYGVSLEGPFSRAFGQ
ncbi:putative glucan endo-1,3-beta-glucosidase GVI [Papaver somniferum]|uniref:putative glucan endo-1,3-beta-glucosidase GVI n=1 Tax=Papaver somniferum TaxID=3469 RepID=UPI000E702625|nr:putative glucan endo-1,3-beta-glucosidase GVI [Papaver somniferum]